MNARLLRPRSAILDPRTLGGLVAWLDASDRSTLFDATTGGSTVSANGGVARWADKSGNGNSATQSTANDRPLLRENNKAGKSVLEFDGTSDFLRIPDANSLDLDAFTFFAVVRIGTYTTGSVRFPAILNKGDYLSAAGTSYELVVNGGLSPFWSTGIASGSTFSNVPATVSVTQNAWALVAARRAVAGAGFAFVNKSSAGNTSVVGGTLNNTSAAVGIGARGTGTPSATGDLFPGIMAEILIYNFAMTDAQMTTVNNYLYGKWAL